MTMHITRKKFLDLGLGTIGAIGLGACGGDDAEGDTGNDTGSSGGDDDDDDSNTNTNPSSPTSDPDDDDGSSSVTVDPSESSTGTTDPTAESSSGPGTDTLDSSSTDPSSSSGPGDESSSSSTGTAEGCESDPTAMFDLHMHTLMIPLADVMAGVDQSYVAGGGHMHDVNVTANDFAELLAGNQVIVMSEPGGAGPHSHMITLICE